MSEAARFFGTKSVFWGARELVPLDLGELTEQRFADKEALLADLRRLGVKEKHRIICGFVFSHLLSPGVSEEEHLHDCGQFYLDPTHRMYQQWEQATGTAITVRWYGFAFVP